MNETYARASAALRAVAEEISLEDILLQLRAFYREALDDTDARTSPDYHWICETAIRSLDVALWRLEAVEGLEEGGG